MPKCNLITLRHGSSSINLLHVFRTPFPKSTSGQLLPDIECEIFTSDKNKASQNS